jgi:hypothetical protein
MLRGQWCDIVLNIYIPTHSKIDYVKDSFYKYVECLFDKFPICHMMLRDLNPKLGREDIFKPTIGNESILRINNENGVKVVNGKWKM